MTRKRRTTTSVTSSEVSSCSGMPGFVAAQLLGALAATLLFRWIGSGQSSS